MNHKSQINIITLQSFEEEELFVKSIKTRKMVKNEGKWEVLYAFRERVKIRDRDGE